jgi:hypothetical protein
VIAAGVVLLAAGPYRARVFPYTQQKFPYATKLAAAGMTRARLVADAAYDFYKFYQKPPAHVAAPVVDTAVVDTAVVDTASVSTRSNATPGVEALLQGMMRPEPPRDSQPPKNTALPAVAARTSTPDSTAPVKAPATLTQTAAAPVRPSAATAPDSGPARQAPPVGAPTKQFATHTPFRANGDSGTAQPLPANATDADRIRRLADELRGHATRANQFMARGDVPHMRSELNALTGEAQVIRVLYPQVADSIHLDQLIRGERGQLYETCQTAAADSTVSLPPKFACVELAPNGGGSNGARGGAADGARPPS